MRTTSEAFEEFRRRLEITATEQEDASRRQRAVRECIQKSFDVKRDFLTGSYKRNTKTKPLVDVDVFVVLGPNEDHRRKTHPSNVLDAFESALKKEFPDREIEPDRRSITVYFERRYQTQHEEGKVVSLDVVPAFDVGAHYEIPDSQLATWITTDPEIHAEQATAKNKELGGNWVPLVKMMRAWNRENGRPVKPSFLIEVMAIELVNGPFQTFQDEVRRFFAAAGTTIHQDWPDPAGLGPPVSDEMTSAMRQKAAEQMRAAEMLCARAFRAETQGSQGEALRLWRQVLGQFFPTS